MRGRNLRRWGLALTIFAIFSVAHAADYVVGDMYDAKGNLQKGKKDDQFDHSVGYIPSGQASEEDKSGGIKLEGLDINVHQFQGGPYDSQRVISVEGKAKQNEKAREDAAKAAATKEGQAEVLKDDPKKQ